MRCRCLVKHLTLVEQGYFGDTFGCPFADKLVWDASDPNADMSDATVEALGLDAVGHVPWWPSERNEVTLHHMLVRVLADTTQHAGHADIIRELLDGTVGQRADDPNLPSTDKAWWSAHHERVEQAAHDAARTT